MAYNPNNTARYFLDYTFPTGEVRTLQVRYEAPATPADVVSWLDVLLFLFSGVLCTGWAVTGARIAAAGSNVTLPTTAPASPTPGGGSITTGGAPRFNAFQGRDTVVGVKSRLSIYGINNGVPADYRWQRGDSPLYDDLLDFIQTPVVGVNISIAGNVTQWYDYLNVGYNSYHERQQRV